MIACMPTSDSWSSREREGETMLWPAVPMKSPMRLMSGLRSLALEVAPPNVWVWATCGDAGAGSGEAGAAIADGFAGSMHGSTCAAVSRMRGSDAGYGV